MNASQVKKGFRTYSLIFVLGTLLTFAGCAINLTTVPSQVTTGTTQVTTGTIPVSAITVDSQDDATTITSQGGTLQMSATVDPNDASDQTVIWTVNDGSGSATISAAGLLGAISDGTVTVTATSASTSAVTDSLVVTISNQDDAMDGQLDLAILTANADKLTIMESIDGSDFVMNLQWVTADVMTTYAVAIAAAQNVADNLIATQSEVDAAIDTLANATAAFNLAKADGTKIVAGIALGNAGNFAILSGTGIATIATSVITGDIGASPVAATYITGFSLIMDGGGEFSTSTQVVGEVYAADYGLITPTYLTTAMADMLLAYHDGMGRTPDYAELFTGDLSGQTLNNGVYKWGGDVLINADLTLDGNSTDIWIFQIAGTLTQAANIRITLTGGALAKNVYWVVADTVALGVGAHFEGIILAKTNISMNTGASLNGRVLVQTSVSLDACIVTEPTEISE